MKRMNLWMLTAILTCGLSLLCSCSSDDNSTDGSKPDTPRTSPVDYTVMLYTIGGENLDWETEADILKACQGLKAQDPNVRFFFQYKYSSQKGLDQQSEKRGGWNFLGKAGGVYRAELEPDMLSDDGKDMRLFTEQMRYGTQQATAELYQPDSIASFIKYCQAVGPAKNYILIIGDHGGGYTTVDDAYKDGRGNTRAVCNDGTLKGNPGITAHELREGIEKSGVHLKMLMYDDCIMNTLEVLGEYQNTTDYVMASNHITRGGNFTHLINSLRNVAANNDFEGEIGKYMEKVISENYDSQLESEEVLEKYPGQKCHCDFVLTDMKKFQGVMSAMKQFTDKLMSMETVLNTLDAADGCYQCSPGSSLYDVTSYVSILNFFNNDLKETADALTKAIEAAQVKHVYTQALSDFLAKSDKYTPDYKKLSYLVNIGCGRTNGVGESFGLLRTSAANDDGDIECIDENGQYWIYESDLDMFTRDKNKVNELATWANSYKMTAFEQTTGWTRWIKKNRDLPRNNPPFFFE